MGNIISQIPGRRKRGQGENTTHIHREGDEESRRQISPTRSHLQPSDNIPTRNQRSDNSSTGREGSDNIPTRNQGSDNSSRRMQGSDNIPARISEDSTPSGSMDEIITLMEDESLRSDPDLANFDDGMKQRTVEVLDSLEQGLKSGGLEVFSPKDVTTGVVEMDHDVVDYIRSFDLDIWKSDEMRDLVTQYFRFGLEALDFCRFLHTSVQHVLDNEMIIESAFGYMPDSREPNEDECRKILQELDLFVHAEDPFSSEFTKLYEQVAGRQTQLKARLNGKMKRLRRRERHFRAVKKVTTVILTATFASLVICAAVAMAVTAPLIPGRSVSAAAALPFEASHGWLRSLWSKYEQRIKMEKEVIDWARWGTFIVITDLETFNIGEEVLMAKKESIVRNIEFGLVKGDSIAVRLIVRMIKRKQDSFLMELDDLNLYLSNCFRSITTARARVWEIILGHSARE